MSNITKTRAVAKMVILTNKRGHVIFNDRLKDGTRSLKVWGWKEQDYVAAKKLLELFDCKVEMIVEDKYSPRGGCHYTMRRLHVQE
jgi:hypothetical protein